MMKPEQGQEIEETCTRCGGLGYTPNLPHVIAKKCPRCKGVGKLNRELLLKAHYRKQAIEEFLGEIEKCERFYTDMITPFLSKEARKLDDIREIAERLIKK